MLGPVELNNTAYTNFARAWPFLPAQFRGLLMVLKFLFEEFLVWFTRCVEVYLRYRFGTRGHSIYQALQLTLAGCLGWAGFAHPEPAMAWFCLVAAILSAYHLIEAHIWEKYHKPPRYSWSDGDPIPIWDLLARGLQAVGIDPTRFMSVSLICRFGEPLLCLLVGLAFYYVSKTLCGVLTTCSIALFLKSMIVHHRMVNMRRDVIDSRIFSEWLMSVHRGASGNDAQQCFVVRLGSPLAETDAANGTASAQTNNGVDPIIVFNCGGCKKPFRMPRRHLGKSGRCKRCGHFMIVRNEAQTA